MLFVRVRESKPMVFRDALEVAEGMLVGRTEVVGVGDSVGVAELIGGVVIVTEGDSDVDVLVVVERVGVERPGLVAGACSVAELREEGIEVETRVGLQAVSAARTATIITATRGTLTLSDY